MPFISKTQRQTDYSKFSSNIPIVIDNGASYFGIGWAGESEPRIVFLNIVQRPRHKTTGETVTIVGDHDPALLKYFDCTRSGPRSAFDNDVVYQFEIMEYILDFGLDRLGANQSQNVLSIQYNRAVKWLNCCLSHTEFLQWIHIDICLTTAFGIDAAFNYKYNQQVGVCNNDGLAISSGFSTSHAIPFVNGEPIYEACCRTNVGGYHVTDYLKELLSLKYPRHMSSLTWEKVEDLKMEHCYVTPDYTSETRLFQNGTKEAEEKTRCWQLPWTPAPVEVPPSEEDVARKAASRERAGQRLREMAEAKKTSRINELENEHRGLEFLLQQLTHVDESEIPSFLSATGYQSKKEVESAAAKVLQTLKKAKGEQDEPEKDSSTAEKYALLDIPDHMLTNEQMRDKRKQLFIKSTSEARQRAKQKRMDLEIERERKNKLEEHKRLENPELYLEQLREKYRELFEKVEQRKLPKTNGSHSNGNNSMSGNVGRGERLNAAQKERMRLLTTAAFDRGKGEDTFGMKDEDWQLYKKMGKDNDDDDEADEDEAELARISSKLKEVDPTFIFKPESGSSATELPRFRPLGKEDFQIALGVERFRCPEILLNPSIVGIDQVGLDEIGGVSLRRLPSMCDSLGERITNSILMTGGSCLFPGMADRLEAGMRMIRPCGAPIRVLKASDAILDAWRGAATYASSAQFLQQTFTRMDYYEKGEDWLRRYQFKYAL